MADGNEGRATPLGTRAVERFLRRRYNLQGPVATDHLRGDISPSVEMRPVLPEDFLDYDQQLIGGLFSQAAVAAQFSFLEIDAPATNFDLVIETIRVRGQSWLVRENTVGSYGAVVQVSPRNWDTGLMGNSIAPMLPWGGVASTAAPSSTAIAFGANGGEWNRPIILRAGALDAVFIALEVVNTAMDVTIFARYVPIVG